MQIIIIVTIIIINILSITLTITIQTIKKNLIAKEHKHNHSFQACGLVLQSLYLLYYQLLSKSTISQSQINPISQEISPPGEVQQSGYFMSGLQVLTSQCTTSSESDLEKYSKSNLITTQHKSISIKQLVSILVYLSYCSCFMFQMWLKFITYLGLVNNTLHLLVGDYLLSFCSCHYPFYQTREDSLCLVLLQSLFCHH